MQLILRLAAITSVLSAVSLFGQARNVLVFPSAGSVASIVSENLTPVATFPTPPARVIGVFPRPDGSKLFIVSQSATDSVMVLDSGFAGTPRRLSFGSIPTAAALTPDGQRLIVVAGSSLRILDAVSETEISSPFNTQGTATDVALSPEGRYAYVLSPTVNRLFQIDLTTNTAVNTISVSGQAAGVTVAPNGDVWVSAANLFTVYDGRTMAKLQDLSTNAQPGKMRITPDGQWGIVPNRNVVTGASVILVNLTTRTIGGTVLVTESGIGSIQIDDIVLLGNARAIAYSQSQQRIYDIRVNPLSANPVNFGTGVPVNVSGIAATEEIPAASAFYYVSNGNLYRADPNTNSLGQNLTTGTAQVFLAGSPSVGPATSLTVFNNSQAVAGGATLRPFFIRALDAQGRPVANQSINVTSSSSAVFIPTPSLTTNGNGIATLVLNAPTVDGQYTINAATPQGISTSLTFTVGSGSPGGGSGGAGGLRKVAGDGQLVRASTISVQPMVVEFRDAAGQPVVGATITWAVQSGDVALTLRETVTDASGQASTQFIAPPFVVGIGTNFSQSVITASTSTGQTATFYATAFPFDIAQAPTVRLINPPQEDRNVVLKAGEPAAGAVRAVVTSVLAQPIPNVGLTVSTNLDPNIGPTISCQEGIPLSDNQGTASCTAIAGGRLGSAPATVNIGGLFDFTFNLTVTPGAPDVPRIISGNNQTIRAGETTPLALVAQITDKGGNILPGLDVTWEVVTPGALILVNPISRTDASGRVSTQVRAGNTAGTFQIRLRQGANTITFNVAVTQVITNFVITSGTNQPVVNVGSAFPLPLRVRVTDQTGNPVPGVAVGFGITSGSASLSATSVTTNANGEAEIRVTAGATPGTITIVATLPGLPSLNFTLQSRLPGPQLDTTSFVDFGTGENYLVRGSLAYVRGANLVPGFSGTEIANPLFGGYPFRMQGLTIEFAGGAFAPIQRVTNSGGVEFAIFQVPFEVQGDATSITIRTNQGVAATVNNIQVRSYAPAFYEYEDAGVRRVLAIRSDGLPVTQNTPARRGERIRVIALGLGQTTSIAETNRFGVPGQAVNGRVLVALDNAAITPSVVQLAVNQIGLYEIEFTVPTNAQLGERSFGFTLEVAPGQVFYSNAYNLTVGAQ